jgi:hypothetical protein
VSKELSNFYFGRKHQHFLVELEKAGLLRAGQNLRAAKSLPVCLPSRKQQMVYREIDLSPCYSRSAWVSSRAFLLAYKTVFGAAVLLG